MCLKCRRLSLYLKFIQKNRILRKLIKYFGRIRAKNLIKKIQLYLKNSDNILDIGAGPCLVCEILNEQNYNVTPVDVKNFSFSKNINPIIFDGSNIPFNKDKFNMSLLITVLHHANDPQKLIDEAKRVSSNRLIIIEDIYKNKIHKYLTFILDSLVNFEFFGHPHNNKTDNEWKSIFKNLGLKLIDVQYRTSLFIFSHAIYLLEK
jgi:SAM-dependent methyltransferase